MNRLNRPAGLLLVLTISALANTVTERSEDRVGYAPARSYYEANVDLAEPERERIQKHLAFVEADMRRHPPAGLSDAQRTRRLALLDSLREYRRRGVFPKNLDFPDRLIPYFIDAAGVPCAMGQLIIASGHADLAEDVRATMNNAYIAEIAAADPRLAAWGAEHGITLEEAARVQPGYGSSLTMVVGIELDHFGRPWVFGPDNGSLGLSGLLGYRDSASWKVAANIFGPVGGFCLSADGRALVASGSGGLHWPISATGSQSSPGRFHGHELTSCVWLPGDSVAWAGGTKGLARLRRSAADTLALTTYATPPSHSDTILAMAQAAGRVWVGTQQGLYARNFSNPETLVGWDSAALGGLRVTGLKGDGTGAGTVVWAGIDGAEFVGPGVTSSLFSTRGLRRIVGDSVRALRSGPGTLFVFPNDTVLALAVRDSVSAWIAVPSGFYRVGNPDAPGPLWVADLPTPGMVINDMAGSADEFYAATNNGVYHFRDDTLVFIGSPVVSLNGLQRASDRRPVGGPQVRLKPARAFHEAVTLDGREAGAARAAGVYFAPRSAPGTSAE